MGYFTFKLKSNGAVLHLVPPFALYTHIPYDSLHFHAISGHSSCILSGDGGLRRTRSSLSARLVDPVGVGGELGAQCGSRGDGRLEIARCVAYSLLYSSQSVT